jgi:hypothetical protein
MRYLSEDDKTKLCRGSANKITATYYDLVSEVVTVVSKDCLAAYENMFSTHQLLRPIQFNSEGKENRVFIAETAPRCTKASRS